MGSSGIGDSDMTSSLRSWCVMLSVIHDCLNVGDASQ